MDIAEIVASAIPQQVMQKKKIIVNEELVIA
jgi:hypothetical protein